LTLTVAATACGTAMAKPLAVRTARHRRLTFGLHAESLELQDIRDWER